jgi:acyl carrier protein
MNKLLDDLNDVLRTVFADDALTVTSATTADDVDGWDSMMHINVIIAVEKRFGVKFAAAEVNGLKGDGQNIGTFLALLAKKLGRT